MCFDYNELQPKFRRGVYYALLKITPSMRRKVSSGGGSAKGGNPACPSVGQGVSPVFIGRIEALWADISRELMKYPG
ncbi:hypothetical protein ACFLQL_00990 [Verrucomicrobiota bacterium]